MAVLICFGLGSLLFGSFDYVSVNVDGGRTSLEQRVYTKEHKETDSTNYVEELMYKYKSDKSRDDHSYVKLYNMLFANIRHTVTNITEIGISAGESSKGCMYCLFI